MHHKPFFPPGSSTAPHVPVPVPGSPTPNVQRTFSPASATSEDRATMELAALEIARLTEEVDYLRDSLAHEQDARLSAEAHLLSMEDRLLDLEQAVREDCVAEFEQRLAIEQARWKAGMQVEAERGEEHWDRKVELLAQSMGADGDGDAAEDDGEDKENVLVENLEQENERLRHELAVRRRELAGRSPTKRKPLAEREEMTAGSPRGSVKGANGETLQRKMEALRVSEDGGRGSTGSRKDSHGSPKKMRKLANRRWDSTLDDDDLF
jgi:hypothetical protein